MISPRRAIIRPFSESDPSAIASVLSGSSPEYLRWFRPFAFDEATIRSLVFAGKLDQWFVIEIEQREGAEPAGFYMLRGMDEGFVEPMYGVFIAECHAGLGLARLTLAHAEVQCRLNGWKTLLLKVDPENTRAFRLYQSCGFEFRRVDSGNGNHVLAKTILR